MNWHFEQRVDLQHPSGMLSYPEPLMAQGDHLAHTWRVQVYSNDRPMDLTGYAVVGYFDRSDGKTVPVTGTAVGHVASVALPQGVYVANGPLTGLLRATKDGQVITLAAGRWNVRRGPGDEIVDPEHVVPSLDELLARIGEMEAKTNAADAAADRADTAANAAGDAAEKAETAAGKADAAAASVIGAAEKADTAAKNANEAANAADAAAGSADAAAANANAKANAAQIAADHAGTAAADADAAAGRADQAATAANTAAQSIDTKVEDAVAPVIEDVAAITDEINFLHPLTITKFSVSPSMAEKGSTVTNETFAYGVNRLNVSLSLEGEPVTGQSAARTDCLTAGRAYTLSASLGGASAYAMATISFVAPVYYGVGASYALTNGTVLALTRVLTKSRARTINVNAGAGQYILYALPAALGTPVFKVGGFEGGFTFAGAFNFTNASGHMERYSLYRSVNAGLGNTSVTIS